MALEIRPATEGNRSWIDALMLERWSGPTQVADGREYRPADLPGFVATEDGSPVGYAPFEVIGDTCWVALLQSFREGRGIGTALVGAALTEGRARRCARGRGHHDEPTTRGPSGSTNGWASTAPRCAPAPSPRRGR